MVMMKAQKEIRDLVIMIGEEGLDYALENYCDVEKIRMEDEALAQWIGQYQLARNKIVSMFVQKYGENVDG